MARPTKHNVDYFSHDCDMRNDIKIKALRRKYKHLGYSIYNITLELLGDTEYFQMKWDNDSIELLTSDYDCDTEELNEVINYCIHLGLLQLTHGYLHCENFSKRLEETVLSRRKDYCSNNSPISKLNEVNVNNNEVIDNNNRQSKVKYSKVKESKLNKSIVEKLIEELFYADIPSDIENILDDLDELGWDNIYSVLEATEDTKKQLKQLVANKVIILQTQ